MLKRKRKDKNPINDIIEKSDDDNKNTIIFIIVKDIFKNNNYFIYIKLGIPSEF